MTLPTSWAERPYLVLLLIVIWVLISGFVYEGVKASIRTLVRWYVTHQEGKVRDAEMLRPAESFRVPVPTSESSQATPVSSPPYATQEDASRAVEGFDETVRAFAEQHAQFRAQFGAAVNTATVHHRHLADMIRRIAVAPVPPGTSSTTVRVVSETRGPAALNIDDLQARLTQMGRALSTEQSGAAPGTTLKYIESRPLPEPPPRRTAWERLRDDDSD